MEVKDWKIFLSVPEIGEKLYDKGFTEKECEAIIYICKRAGMREVVEWLKHWQRKPEAFSLKRTTIYTGDILIRSEEGQTQLEKWGV